MKKIDFTGLPGIVTEFLSYMEIIKGRSDLTVFEYANDLRTYFRFLKLKNGLVPDDMEFEQIPINDIDLDFIKKTTLEDAYAYLSFCKNERNNNANTRSRKVSCLRTFYSYLTLKTNQLQKNPMTGLDTPKTKKSLPKYLTLDSSKKLLQSIDGKNKERDYLIIILFLNCGIRLSELVSLNIGDIQDNVMKVTGKGNKERNVYLNDSCIAALNDYLKVRPKDGVKDKNALILSGRKQRISPKTVQYIVKSFLDKAGLGGQGYSTHKLRHTAATLMYQYGDVDIMVLKEILGHENLSATQIYTHVANEQIEKALNANPLSNIKTKKQKP